MVWQFPVLTSRFRGAWLAAGVSVAASTVFTLFGFEQGIMSGLLTEDEFFKSFPRIASPVGVRPADAPPLDEALQGFVVSIFELGAMLGSLLVLWQGDNIGRRSCMIGGAIIMIVGTLTMVFSSSLLVFSIGRAITGIGNGLATSTAPVWHSELSKAHNRGMLVMLEGSFIALGIAMSYCIDYAFFHIKDSGVQWRVPIGFLIVFALLVLIGVLCLPESPRWCMRMGMKEQATQIIAQLEDLEEDHAIVQHSIQQLEETVQQAEREYGAFKVSELLTMDKNQNLYRTAVAVVAQSMQQLSGINLITYFSVTIIKTIVPDDNAARVLTCFSGIEYFAASLVALLLIDTFGRRKLMLSSSFLMAISMAVLCATIGALNSGSSIKDAAASAVQNGPLKYVAATFLFLFNTWFAFGWLGCSWLMAAEITNLRIRSPANALATCANWIFNSIIVLIAPSCFKYLHHWTYLLFALLNLSFLPIIYCFFPEPRRRGLEELDIIFAESHEQGWWDSKHCMTRACYLSLHKKFLTPQETDEELALWFGNGEVKKVNPAQQQQEALSTKDELTEVKTIASSDEDDDSESYRGNYRSISPRSSVSTQDYRMNFA